MGHHTSMPPHGAGLQPHSAGPPPGHAPPRSSPPAPNHLQLARRPGQNETVPVAPLNPHGFPLESDPYYKTQLCTKFFEGTCQAGQGCFNAHSQEEVRTSPEMLQIMTMSMMNPMMNPMGMMPPMMPTQFPSG